MLEEMKGIQSKLEAEQGALNSTSATYMEMVKTTKPVVELQDGDAMEDPLSRKL